eukprot:m.226684 g.226684  ORF g.226684 m.226684 type:complete len:528 (-) comp18802_c0_seq1:193-1776(-)
MTLAMLSAASRVAACTLVVALGLLAQAPLSGASLVAPQWYGADSDLSRISFKCSVDLTLPSKQKDSRDALEPIQEAEDFLSKERLPATKQHIMDQVRYTFGVWTTHSIFATTPGVVQLEGRLRVLSAEFVEVHGVSKVRIAYQYSDNVVFHRGVQLEVGSTLSFVLPKDPVGVYERGFKTPRKEGDINLCTDTKYNQLRDMWYFFNPSKEGCPLTKADLISVKATLEPMAATTLTYPEYDLLFGLGTKKKSVVLVTHIVSLDESMRYSDLGYVNFDTVGKGLVSRFGFEVLEQTWRDMVLFREGDEFDVKVELKFMNPAEGSFDRTVVAGMENSNIFIYDGHSGLGGHMSRERLEKKMGRKIKLPKRTYQIFFFNGCSTFSYYNAAYTKLKRTRKEKLGTKYLDIVGSGVGAVLNAGHARDLSFYRGLFGRHSWQNIIDAIAKHDLAWDLTGLFHINNDLDNPDVPSVVAERKKARKEQARQRAAAKAAKAEAKAARQAAKRERKAKAAAEAQAEAEAETEEGHVYT